MALPLYVVPVAARFCHEVLEVSEETRAFYRGCAWNQFLAHLAETLPALDAFDALPPAEQDKEDASINPSKAMALACARWGAWGDSFQMKLLLNAELRSSADGKVVKHATRDWVLEGSLFFFAGCAMGGKLTQADERCGIPRAFFADGAYFLIACAAVCGQKSDFALIVREMPNIAVNMAGRVVDKPMQIRSGVYAALMENPEENGPAQRAIADLVHLLTKKEIAPDVWKPASTRLTSPFLRAVAPSA
jgi:hypothetical protein